MFRKALTLIVVVGMIALVTGCAAASDISDGPETDQGWAWEESIANPGVITDWMPSDITDRTVNGYEGPVVQPDWMPSDITKG